MSNFSNGQNVNDNKKLYFFDGVELKTKVEVNNLKSQIEVTIYDKIKNQKIDTKVIQFEELFFENKIKIFNSIILLQDERGVHYYDLLNQNKYYTKIGNRYNEDLEVGKYNPILENNILVVINYKLEVVDILNIKNFLKQGESWTLYSNTDVNNGKISLLKIVPNKTNGRFDYLEFIYDVKNKVFKQIKKTN